MAKNQYKLKMTYTQKQQITFNNETNTRSVKPILKRQVTKLVHKSCKTILVNTLYMFKKLAKTLNMLSRNLNRSF